MHGLNLPSPGTKPSQSSLDIYVRLATHGDAENLLYLYNFYVLQSPFVREHQPLAVADMKCWIDSAKAEQLPFLVAHHRGQAPKVYVSSARTPSNTNTQSNPPTSSRRFRAPGGDDEIFPPDTFVGFARATRCASWSLQLHIFTADRYRLKGVATCLLDHMLSICDPSYTRRGGYDFEGALPAKIPAPTPRTLRIDVPYEVTDKTRLDFKSRFLISSAGFVRAKGVVVEGWRKKDWT